MRKMVVVFSVSIAVVWSGSSAGEPDGKIAFTSNRDSNSLDIFMMQADGSDPVNLTDHPSVNRRPSWSPDGTRIVFESERDFGDVELYVMNEDGSRQRNLTNDPANDFIPSWSPDGTRIAFRSRRDGRNKDIGS